MEIGSSIDEGTSVKKKTGFMYHIDRTRRWPRPDINFRMKHEMSDNNSVNFWCTKMVHPFWNSQSKAFGVNIESSAHLNLLSTPERPPSYHLGGCNPSAEEPGNEQMDVHLKLLLQCSICSLNECPMIKMYSNK